MNIPNPVIDVAPAKPEVALAHFSRKLEFETDCADVHYGLAPATARRRSEALAAARNQYPTRFATDHDPKILDLPPAAWINEPKKTEEDTAA